jgi:hypothetical protein
VTIDEQTVIIRDLLGQLLAKIEFEVELYKLSNASLCREVMELKARLAVLDKDDKVE